MKLSLSLAVVYAFYQFVLRRLTFYNWNRFYLIAYTALSFFIPFINITPVLERNEMLDNRAVQFIPSVNTFNSIDPVVQFQSERSISFSTWDWLLFCIGAGVIIMLVRLLIQLISFRKIIRKAKLVSDDSVKLYQVDQPVIPFSFGNSIFLNQHQHSEGELREIIRHEFVHIKQKHTIDIIWSELLFILNWYNPFAWVIRKSIRQNLEFIADNKVLQSGIDKRQYQYLLLKVTGNNHFSIASQFNFSSLKKRIAMMNKMKSARVHLLKFLFMLPLLAVLILSFRNNRADKIIDENTGIVSGIVYDYDTKMPLQNAQIEEKSNGIKTLSDENGFFSIKVPVTDNGRNHFLVSILKQGYKNSVNSFGVDPTSRYSSVILIGIPQENSKQLGSFMIPGVGTTDKQGKLVTSSDYKFVKEKFDENLEREKLLEKIDKIAGNSEKPIWVIDGVPYAIANGMHAWFDEDEIKSSPEFRVCVDGEIMTMEEANMKVRSSDVKSVGASPAAFAKKYHHVNYNLLLLMINKSLDYIENADGSGKVEVRSRISSDTIPRVQTIALSRDDKMDDAHKTFFTKNKNVKLLYWKNDLNTLEVYLDNGSVDEYDLKNKESILVGESKYGPLPSPAMGSYRVFTNKGNSLVLKGGSGNYTVVVGDNNFKEIARIPLDDWNKKKSYYENLYGEMPPILKMLTESKATDVTIDEPSKQYDASFFKGDNQPLVIMDGVEQPENTDPGSLLRPEEIAEMKVWKPGSTTGEYGYKGRNGVIIINSRAYAGKDVEATVSTPAAAGINEKPAIATTSGFGTIEQPKAVSPTGTTISGAPEKANSATVESVGTTVSTKEVSATVDPKRIAGKTVAPEKTNAATVEKAGTTVPAKGVSATINPKRAAGETVAPVKEININKNILALIKNNITENELRKIEKDLKSKGYVFRAVRTEYKDGKLILISGTINKANVEGGQVFTASDFSQVIISEDPDEEGNLFNFLVESGKLSVFNAN